jgi:hypothetical protein
MCVTLPPNSCPTCWGAARELSVQVMRWWFVGITQEPSDSPLDLHFKWGRTNFVKCEERAYYLFNTRRVCYKLVPQWQNVNQRYHIDTLWRLGDVAIGFCTNTIRLPIVLCLFVNFWLETKCHFMCTFLPRFSACDSPSPFQKTKMVLKGRKINDHNSNKIVECTYWVSNSALHLIFQMVVRSLSSLQTVQKRQLYGRHHWL